METLPLRLLVALRKASITTSRLGQHIWTRQIRASLLWLRAFMEHRRGTMIRSYRLRHHFNEAACLTVAFDASPHGMGGILLLGVVIIAFFSDALTLLDTSRFRWDLGDSDGQQTWEALALLVALRLWRHRWHSQRFRVAWLFKATQ